MTKRDAPPAPVLLSIGRFSQLTRLSVKALRWYDEVGLLRPAAVDPRSGYRSYRPDQFGTAERIRRLREADLPLPEVAALLAAPDAAGRRAVLERHRERLERDLAERRLALDRLLLLAHEEEHMTPSATPDLASTFTVTAAPPRHVVFVRARASLATIGDVTKGAFAELHGWLAARGLSPAGPALCTYPDPEFDADDFAVEAGVPIAAPPDPALLTGRVQVGEIPGGPVVSAVHVGPYETLHLAYQTVLAEAGARGLEVAGPPREVYLAGRGDGAPPEAFRTAIEYPLRG